MKKNLSGIPSKCQTDLIQIRPILSGLVWVKVVCKCYQQTTLVDKYKDLNDQDVVNLTTVYIVY